MNNYDYIIIDDEPKAVKLLKNKLSELYPNLQLKSEHNFWVPALDALRHSKFDILFLDISMPQKDGMDLLELAPDLNCEIIFITAYEEYALEAFNHAATGYILKPINDTLLTKAVDKAIKRIQDKRNAEKHISNEISRAKNTIGIHNNKGIDYVDINTISYFEATNRYTRIVTENLTYLSSYNIGKFKEIMDGYDFYQVHRSYIVNLHHIKRYESSGIIIMRDGNQVPVSRNLRDDFLKQFDSI
jgi:two-component system LytT family response regulator